MSGVLIWSLVGTLIVSFLSLVGIVTFGLKEKTLNKILILLVAFSTGTLIGGAFFHLLPEAIKGEEKLNIFISLVLGIALFFLLERVLHWHHCHKYGECKVHIFTYMNLIGDGIHNFLDGLIIFSAFNVNFNLGITTTLAVISHELPQEIGDFGVLLYGGFNKVKALFLNFLSAISAIVGVFSGYFILEVFRNFSPFLLSFAAGGFIYIAMSDLMPELHKESQLSKSLVNFCFFVIGVIFMLVIKLYFRE